MYKSTNDIKINSICALNENKNTCLPLESITVLSKIATPENAQIKDKHILINKISNSLECDDKLSIQEKELCIIKKIKKETNNAELKTALDKQEIKFFKPKTKSYDHNYWLNNTEIDSIQHQLQEKFKGYYFSTIHMIDLEKFDPNNVNIFKNNDKIFNIKDINFVDELKQNANAKLNFNGKLKYFGTVCNTDLSTNGGIHWFSMFIDFTTNPIQIEYFNSSGRSLTQGNHLENRKLFYKFFKNIEDELNKNGFPAKFIQATSIEHQKDNTANCGSYSLFYIWERLNGRNYKYFEDNKITDDLVRKFREVLWRVDK